MLSSIVFFLRVGFVFSMNTSCFLSVPFYGDNMYVVCEGKVLIKPCCTDTNLLVFVLVEVIVTNGNSGKLVDFFLLKNS